MTAVRDRQPGRIDFQPVGEPMIAGNEPTDGMSLVIFFLGEEAPQSGFELCLGIVFPRGGQKETGIIDKAVEARESFFIVPEGAPAGILRQVHLLRRNEQRGEVGRFVGLKRRARKQDQQKEQEPVWECGPDERPAFPGDTLQGIRPSLDGFSDNHIFNCQTIKDVRHRIHLLNWDE